MPHGEVNKHLDDTKRICPTISRNIFNRAIRLHWSSLFSEDDDYRLVSNKNENESESYDDSRQKGGRPVGSSIVTKHETELRSVKLHNNISIRYALEKSSPPVLKYYL